ncbi:MAG: glycosyltransferase family 39 protein [Acidobacteriota bacterium]
MPSPRRAAVGILCLHGLLQGLLGWLYCAGGGKGLVGDEQTYRAAAEAMATTGRLALDPLWPPLYPWLLSRLYLLPGDPLVWTLVLQALAVPAIVWLWWRLGERLTGSASVAALGATGLLLYPPLVAYGHFLWPEILHLLLLSLALWLLTAAGATWRSALAAGALLGLALGAKALLLGFLPVLVLLPARAEGSRPWPSLIALAAAVALLASPWTPWARAHSSPAVAGSLEFNLRLGIDREVGRERSGEAAWRLFQAMEKAEARGTGRRAFLRRQLADELAERGPWSIARDQLQRQYFRLLDHRTFFHDQLPTGPRQGPERGYQGVPSAVGAALRVGSSAIYLLILTLTPLGLLAWRRRGQGRWWLVPAFLVYNFLLFFALYAISRYRIQMLPFLTLTAALGGAELKRGMTALPAWEKAIALAGAVLLLYLALG